MNTLTDSLKIVTREEGKGTFALFKRKRAEHYGFALVVFRKKALLGFIPSSDIAVESDLQRRYDRLGIKDGDTILSINLGPQRLKITETMPTSDNAPRYYEIELDIAVNDPIQFAQRYIQESDPVAWAKTAIEGFIYYNASQWDHDDLNETMLRSWVLQALTIPQNATSGLRVSAVHKAPLQMNRDRSVAFDIARRRKLEELQIQNDGYIGRARKQEEFHLEEMVADEQRKNLEAQSEAQRREELKQIDHDNIKVLAELDEQVKRGEKNHLLQTRVEEQRHTLDMIKQGNAEGERLVKLLEEGKLLVHQHQIEQARHQHQLALDGMKFESVMRQRWITSIGEEAIPALNTRIKEQLSNDRSTLGTAVSEPELQYLLDILSGDKRNSTSGNLLGIPQNTSRVSPVSENTSPKDQSPITGQFRTLKMLPGVIEQTKEVIEIPDLGLRLIETTMSEEQQRAASTETSIGFIVYMINRNGVAGKTNLQVSDIVVAISSSSAEQGDTEREITSIQDISQAISKHETGSEIIFIVLRDQHMENITLKTTR